MTEAKLVTDALKKAKQAINKDKILDAEIVECIGIINFLIDHVKTEEYRTGLMEVSCDLMMYLMFK